jgi:hypothetical protein
MTNDRLFSATLHPRSSQRIRQALVPAIGVPVLTIQASGEMPDSVRRHLRKAFGRLTVKYFNLYHISAYLLILGTLGHTFGGMVGTLRKGRQSGVEADEVFAKMKSVHFKWNGADCTWFGFWLGNGLSVSALLLLAITVLWVLGGLPPYRSDPAVLGWGAQTLEVSCRACRVEGSA